jgi:hypothetical protein
MVKNDGLAEVRKSQFGWQVIINHFEGQPEIWDKYTTEQEAKEEVVLWNNGIWGEGFTYSAEWLRLKAKE